MMLANPKTFKAKRISQLRVLMCGFVKFSNRDLALWMRVHRPEKGFTHLNFSSCFCLAQ